MEINPILVAKSDKSNYLLPKMANRHGLIAGATGTGKTVSLQVLAEGFSRIGVPVFLADVKGDLAGISQPGGSNSKVSERIESLQLSNFEYEGSPVVFWDIYGKKGHPVRTTISEMGPFLLSRLLNLNDTQSATLTLIFRAADDARMLLLDMKDIRSMVQYVGENADKFNNQYGRVSTASIGAIQRALLNLEEAGGDVLFGEPALNIDDLMQIDANGKGIINILASDKLILSPAVYSTFLLWLMSEMFEELPEVGDMDKPKIVFFFDEAHLLFDEAPKALQDKIEQVVRLIRSKGVGVYFVTQNPTDIPDDVLGQLGNRVQHALRAFTPRDQKAIKVAAETFRINPNLDVEKAISEVEVGEALVSFLNEDGAPSVVERAYVLPPHSKIGPITDEQRKIIIEKSAVFGTYEEEIDRESAYEMLNVKAQIEAKANQVQTPVQQPNVMNTNPQNTAAPRGGGAKSLLNNVVRNLTGGGGAGGIGRAITGGSGGGIAKKIMRGILGSFLR